MAEDEHYLRSELYELVRKDPAIFEFLRAGSLDGIWYWDVERQDQEWMSPRFKELSGSRDGGTSATCGSRNTDAMRGSPLSPTWSSLPAPITAGNWT